jgi:hypothetical protein
MRIPAPEPRGPGASLSALTWVGWVSLIAAVAWFLVSMRPLLDTGDIGTWNWGEVTWLAWRGLADAAIIALPAALEWGVPGARRRTPLLLRGTVLLALLLVARGALTLIQAWLFDTTDFGFDFESPIGLSLTLVQLGTVVLGIAGVWAISDGLVDVGSRLSRRLLAAAIVVGLILGAWIVPIYAVSVDDLGSALGRPLFWLNLVGLVLYVVDSVLWCIVAVRLLAGFTARLRPGRGWAIGALAGAAMLAARALSMLLSITGGQDAWLTVVAQLLYDAPWILLVLAFLAGVGRGRERRDAPPPRMHLFIRNPTD